MKRFFATFFAISLAFLSPLQAQDLRVIADPVAARAFLADLGALWELEGKGSFELLVSDSNTAILLGGEEDPADLGGVSRPSVTTVSAERRAAIQPLVWDALVVAVHPDVGQVNLSAVFVKRLLNGTVTNWQDVAGPDLPVQLLAMAAGDVGVEQLAREMFLADPTADIAASQTFDNYDDMLNALESTPGAFIISSYATMRRQQVKIAAFEGVLPSPNTIGNGSYALFVPMYLVNQRGSSEARRLIRDFTRFAGSTTAKRVLRRTGVLPYSEHIGLVSQGFERNSRLGRNIAD